MDKAEQSCSAFVLSVGADKLMPELKLILAHTKHLKKPLVFDILFTHEK